MWHYLTQFFVASGHPEDGRHPPQGELGVGAGGKGVGLVRNGGPEIKLILLDFRIKIYFFLENT